MILVALAGLIFGFAFFLVGATWGVFTRAYERYERVYLVRSARRFSDLFLFVEPRQVLLLNVSSMLGLGVVGWMVLNPIASIALMLLGAFLPSLWISQYRRRRLRKFNAQLMDALQAMANAFGAGRTFAQAIEHVAEESAAPLSQEFGLLVKEMKLGVPMEEALVNMSRRVGSDDLDLVVTSTNVARQLGGNMAEMFEMIAATIRERFRLEGKIEALTAQGRIQGWILGAMPLVLGAIVWWIRPDLIEPVMKHLFGYVLLALIAGMEISGMLIIRRIVNVDI